MIANKPLFTGCFVVLSSFESFINQKIYILYLELDKENEERKKKTETHYIPAEANHSGSHFVNAISMRRCKDLI